MSHVLHSLHDEFPADADLLHKLKLDDAHFQAISERYHETNKDIHRIESGVAPASDEHLEMLKKQRLDMLDEVAGLLARAKAA